MEIKIYAPTKALSTVVEYFWVSEIRETQQQRVFPENCTSLTFHLDESSPYSIFSGITTSYIDYETTAASNILGITFKTGGLAQLTHESLHQIKDKTIIANELIPKFNHLLIEELIDVQQRQKQLSVLEDILLKSLLGNDLKPKLSQLIANEISQYGGNIKSIALAKKFNRSLRQLERIFKREVGISIKLYSRIIRFNNVIHAIKQFPHKSLLELAFDYGYYDHAHLANEIQFFSGYAPSYFRTATNGLILSEV